MIGTTEIDRMTSAERLRTMELLWRSIASQDKVASPAWHKKVLTSRLAKVESGEGEFMTISQLKKRLAKHSA